MVNGYFRLGRSGDIHSRMILSIWGFLWDQFLKAKEILWFSLNGAALIEKGDVSPLSVNRPTNDSAYFKSFMEVFASQK